MTSPRHCRLRGAVPAFTGMCPDILLEIFNHLQPERCPRSDKRAAQKQRRLCRQTLRACALTCRGFSDLALDVLWRALDDILPILKLVSGNKRPFVLNPHIKHETWQRCQRYAARVREIGLRPDPDRVHLSVWTFLAIKCEGSPLFPRLYHLDADDLALDELPPLFLLLTPSLRSLSLSFIDDRGKGGSCDSQVSVSVLQHIARVAPNIKTCLISGRHCFTTHTHLSTLRDFAGLTELSLDADEYGFNEAMLRQLSTMTSLVALTVTITRLDPSRLQPLRDSFPLLHRLKLRGRLEDLVQLILAWRLPLLHELIIQINGHESPENLARRLAQLSQHPDLAKSLTHLRLNVSSTAYHPVQTLAHYRGLLLSFSKLEYCDLDFGTARPSICDDDLIRLGDAWPNLQHLNIRGRTRAYQDDRHGWPPHRRGGDTARGNAPDVLYPTVLGLTELARRCPALRYVHLVTLNAKTGQGTLPQGRAASRTQVASSYPSLRELLFESVDNASTAALRCALVERLDAAFPGLDVSRSKAECAYPHERPDWRRTMLLLRALRYRRDPKNLGPNAHRRAAAAAKFAVSRRSLAGVDKALSDAEDGDSDREWDFDSDSDEEEDEDGDSYLSGSESQREGSVSWESDY